MHKHIGFLITLLCLSSTAYAQGVNMSVSAGWPFFLIPTVSTTYNDIELYVNYKVGLDDGFTVGAEKQYGHHVFGAFVGAVGARDADYLCEADDSCPPLRIVFTDAQTTQGLGLSYEYRINQGREGWAFRAEAGYGKESQNDTKRVDGNVQVVYHF